MSHETMVALINARIATCADDAVSVIESGFVAWRDGRITAIGAMADWGTASQGLDAHLLIDARRALVTPGLIDCHTHLVYAGSRANEFEMRLEGASYEAIARAGGGIVATVQATRAASEDDLFEQAGTRLRVLQAGGVTSVEIKSGYGLNRVDEAKQLRVARRLAQAFAVDVRTTFLGAHALPPEYLGRAEDYIDLVVDDIMPALAADGLVDAVDAFCEDIGFSPAQTRRVFEAARRLGLPVKLHADQLSDLGGAELVAEFGGLSADHVEYASARSVQAMARHGTVAVLLPGAFYFIRERQVPPIEMMRRAGVPMALATDHNPGSSPCLSLPLILNMACTLFRMTPREALLGVTRHAARALGLQASHGTLEPGKVADLAVWDAGGPSDLAYAFGHSRLQRLFKRGVAVTP